MSKRKQARAAAKTKPAATHNTAVSKKEKLPSAGGLNNMTNWLVVLVLLLPLIYSTKAIEPMMSPRYIFFSGFMLIFVLYFFWWRKTPVTHSYPLLMKIIFGTGAVFIVWNFISASSALNPQESFYEIGKQMLFLNVLFCIMISVYREESQLLKLCKTLLWVSVIQGMAGILQYYDIAFTEVPGAKAKPYGLMANRNLFGSAQVFLLPFVLYVLYKASNTWKYISAGAITILIYSVLLSQTRSAWLAAVAIIVISLVLVLVFSPSNRKKWLAGSIAGSAGIALLFLLVLAGDNDGALQQSIRDRTKSLVMQEATDTTTSENVNERIRIWKKTMQLVKDKPFTGAGPGNWKLAIPAYGTEGLVWAKGHYSPDRPHNIYLLAAAETGIPGAVFYFGMWVLIAIAGFKVILKPNSEEQRVLVILMLSGLAAIACDGMFSFPTERREHSLYMLLTGGIILGCYLKVTKQPQEKISPVKKYGLLLMMAILLFNLFIGFKKYRFEVTLNRVKALENLQRYQEMADEAKIGKDMYITLGSATGISMELKRGIALKELKQYDEALKEISVAKRYHPNSAAVRNTEGTIYTELKQYDKAIECYKQAKKITPHNEIVLKNLAVNYFLINDFASCIATIEEMSAPRDAYFEQMIADAKSKMKATAASP